MKRSTIAVVGASRDRRKFGNKCVRAYLQAGYEVYPVNLRESRIEGLRVFRSVEEVPAELTRISVYLPPSKTLELIPSLAQFEGTQVWFNPGSAGPPTLEAARAAGIDVRDGCSIVDLGLSPGQFP